MIRRTETQDLRERLEPLLEPDERLIGAFVALAGPKPYEQLLPPVDLVPLVPEFKDRDERRIWVTIAVTDRSVTIFENENKQSWWAGDPSVRPNRLLRRYDGQTDLGSAVDIWGDSWIDIEAERYWLSGVWLDEARRLRVLTRQAAVIKSELVNIDLRRGILWVCSCSQTIDGFWVMNGVFESLAESVDDEGLGSAVLRARAASRIDVPNRPRLGLSLLQPVLEASGAKSWSKYITGVRAVSVEFEHERAKVVPQRNIGPREGLEPILGAVFEIDGFEAATIGIAVRRGLALAV